MKLIIAVIISVFIAVGAFAACLTDAELSDVADDYFYIETADYKDFSHVLGDILWYSMEKDKSPAIMLVINDEYEEIYLEILQNIKRYHKLDIEIFVKRGY